MWNMPVEDLRLFVERNHNKEFNGEHTNTCKTMHNENVAIFGKTD